MNLEPHRLSVGPALDAPRGGDRIDDLQPASAIADSRLACHPVADRAVVVDFHAHSVRTEQPDRNTAAVVGVQDAVVEKLGCREDGIV